MLRQSGEEEWAEAEIQSSICGNESLPHLEENIQNDSTTMNKKKKMFSL